MIKNKGQSAPGQEKNIHEHGVQRDHVCKCLARILLPSGDTQISLVGPGKMASPGPLPQGPRGCLKHMAEQGDLWAGK